jgi:hypothetical protein
MKSTDFITESKGIDKKLSDTSDRWAERLQDEHGALEDWDPYFGQELYTNAIRDIDDVFGPMFRDNYERLLKSLNNLYNERENTIQQALISNLIDALYNNNYVDF